MINDHLDVTFDDPLAKVFPFSHHPPATLSSSNHGGTQMSDKSDIAQWLEDTYPEMTPNERFMQFQQLTSEAIEAGILAAILRPDGEIVVKQVEWCSDGELERRMSAEQYRLWSER